MEAGKTDGKGVQEKSTDKGTESFSEKSKSYSSKNPWIISTVILGIIVIIGIFFVVKGGVITGNVVSEGNAGDKLVTYLNGRAGGGVSLVSVEPEGSLYKVIVSYKESDIPVYITKDGKYFVQGVSPIDAQPVQTQQQQPSQQEVPKTDNPKVELFVMTECPYGTQAEKGIIPVLELLGNKIDSKIRFVHYFIHGEKEEQETYRQVCIREEQSDKYLDYLRCYLEDGDADRCLEEVKINKGKLNSCLGSKAEEYYASDSEASKGAGVSGSPTLVINGKIVQSGRSPAVYLTTICSAFNNPPAECGEELSPTNPNPGFGYSASSGGTNSAAQCV